MFDNELLNTFFRFWTSFDISIRVKNICFVLIFFGATRKVHSMSAGDLFCQDRKLFSEEIWKMTKCHFWTDVMLRRLIREFRASQKMLGLRVVFLPNFFQVLYFISPVELIWLIGFWVICPWNKFEEKAQCGTVGMRDSVDSKFWFVC